MRITTKLQVVCRNCGANFDMPRWQVARGGKPFCSRSCYHAGRVLPLVDRFNAMVDHTPTESGCVLWTGPVSQNGYGLISLGRKSAGSIGAHRLAYTLRHGPIPDGKVVCHRCDNRRCVNADHLFVGSNLDNSRDMYAKNRARNLRGSQCANAKLTEEKVAEIRQLPDQGFTRPQIAERYGVSITVVGNVLKRRTWRHVP